MSSLGHSGNLYIKSISIFKKTPLYKGHMSTIITYIYIASHYEKPVYNSHYFQLVYLVAFKDRFAYKLIRNTP